MFERTLIIIFVVSATFVALAPVLLDRYKRFVEWRKEKKNV